MRWNSRITVPGNTGCRSTFATRFDADGVLRIRCKRVVWASLTITGARRARPRRVTIANDGTVRFLGARNVVMLSIKTRVTAARGVSWKFETRKVATTTKKTTVSSPRASSTMLRLTFCRLLSLPRRVHHHLLHLSQQPRQRLLYPQPQPRQPLLPPQRAGPPARKSAATSSPGPRALQSHTPSKPSPVPTARRVSPSSLTVRSISCRPASGTLSARCRNHRTIIRRFIRRRRAWMGLRMWRGRRWRGL